MPPTWEGIDRREPDLRFEQWKAHVDRRLDKQDETLTDIRNALGASKLGLAAIKWLVTIGAGIVAIMSFAGKFK